MKDRLPAVSGAFYPSEPEELKSELSSLFENLPLTIDDNVAALIVPHAGYVFSGKVAAAAYSQLNREAHYDNIFLIGVSHRKYFEGVSIYPSGNYVTPLGRLMVNDLISNELMNNNHFIYHDPEADSSEHCLEVQLPFLQFHLKNSFKIVPLLIGGKSKTTCKLLAEVLMPWFTKDNLFVISTDFSHYPSADDAVDLDMEIADAILTNNPGELHQTCLGALNSGIENLATPLCGELAVLTLLYMTQSYKEITYRKIMYQHSGHSPFGKNKKVVGYWAIGAFRPAENFTLSESDKKELLLLAREAITEYVKTGNTIKEGVNYSGILNSKCGAFVSIHKHGHLRGCLGHIENNAPLWQLIKEMAIASASRDHRFEPVAIDELEEIEIEISILSPLVKINSPDQFELGKHGIFIQKGDHSGTFLPQVAHKTNWTKEEFIGHCSRDKAGIGWDGWKKADLFIFEATVFEE